MKVRTHSRLFRGAKLEIAPGVFRRVIREDTSSWSRANGFTSIVEVEPTLVCVGDYTYEASTIE